MEHKIVGYAVFRKRIEQAAIYNVEQKEQAFEAARTWPANIVALVVHPDAPDLSAPAAGGE